MLRQDRELLSGHEILGDQNTPQHLNEKALASHQVFEFLKALSAIDGLIEVVFLEALNLLVLLVFGGPIHQIEPPIADLI